MRLMDITLIQGDCRELLKNIFDNSIDMVFTSPPYADRRKNVYGGIPESQYVDWFKPIAAELKRVLKPTGSFFLNIKPHTNKGERSLYVFDLIISLKREIGFMFVDELCWIKNPFPGALKGRFKNAFEPVYHFTKDTPTNIKFNPTACGTPIKPESVARAYRKQCGKPVNGSGMAGLEQTNLRKIKITRPSNVIHANNVSNQFTLKAKHPATFPGKLVEFFIKSFTDENDTVLDPFMGSGTTGVVCRKLNRKFVGIDIMQEYVDLAHERINS